MSLNVVMPLLLLFIAVSVTIINGAVLQLHCHDHCLQQQVLYTCQVEGSAMEWESTQFENDIELLGSTLVGDMKHDGGFTATLTAKTANNTTSTLVFTINDSLDGAIIYCQDLLDGNKQACHVDIIRIPNPPLNVSINQLSYNSATVQWSADTNDDAAEVLYYIVYTNTTSTSDAINVTSTSLMLQGLVPGVYTTAVVAVNCAGQSNVSVLGPYELVGYVPTIPQLLLGCVCYNNDGYTVLVEWECGEMATLYRPMTSHYNASISNMIGWSSYDVIPGNRCNASYKVPRQDEYNVSVIAINDVGQSDSATIITIVNIEATVDTVRTGQDYALLNITIHWSSPCSHLMPTLDASLVYTDHNGPNQTLHIRHDSCMTDTVDELVYIPDLAPDTVYHCSLYAHQSVINGMFHTLNATNTTTAITTEIQIRETEMADYFPATDKVLIVSTTTTTAVLLLIATICTCVVCIVCAMVCSKRKRQLSATNKLEMCDNDAYGTIVSRY